jgi:Tfp pilus assembly protein PilO
MGSKTSTHDTISIINEKKKAVAVFLSITLVALTLLIAFPIRLMAVSVIKINNEIEGKKRLKETLDTKVRNFNQLNTEYEEVKSDLEDLKLVFPDKGDYSLFVANIEEVCKANYFRLQSVNVDMPRLTGQNTESSFEVLTVWTANINVLGRRSDLLKLLEEIESMPMKPTVNVLSYKNETNEEGFLSFNISVKIYGVKSSNMYSDI